MRARLLLSAILATGIAGFAGEALALDRPCLWNVLTADERAAMVTEFRRDMAAFAKAQPSDERVALWIERCGLLDSESDGYEAGAYLTSKTANRAGAAMLVEDHGIPRATLEAAWNATPPAERRKAGGQLAAYLKDRTAPRDLFFAMLDRLRATLTLPDGADKALVIFAYGGAVTEYWEAP